MKKNAYLIPLLAGLFFLPASPARAEERSGPAAAGNTVGLLLRLPESWDGYTFFAPLNAKTTFLVDPWGRLVRSWESDYSPGNAAYLLPGGHLLRTGRVPGNFTLSGGGAGGVVERYDWDGNRLWQYFYVTDTHRQHHDACPMPNGNVLLIAWESKTRAEALAAGRKPDRVTADGLWPDTVIEVRPTGPTTGEVVWEWHTWDHLVQDYSAARPDYGDPAAHPERVDLNYTAPGFLPAAADWMHTNGVHYNAALDQVVLSVRHFSEFWVIDHGTTPAEAAGHTGGRRGRGGDLLYRWGNPAAYGRGTTGDQVFYGQHHAHWIADGLPGAGHFLVFNNGGGRPGADYSSVDEVSPPLDATGGYLLDSGAAFGPEALTWSYVAPVPPDFYASYISGAVRLPNGNTLVCHGPYGTFFEVTPAGKTVWAYVNPVTGDGALMQGETVPGTSANKENSTFRAYRYAADGPELSGIDLTPGGYIEGYRDGDVNGDLRTDSRDLQILLLVVSGILPSGNPPCTYPERADFDAGGTLDATDLAALAALLAE
ncbi:MAG: aryl-sulfate sulfotransferase [Acidobacteria bacterium]|nr:aryl-sulfate sulfotransferase [Acidobacteriota bacterium]